MNWYILLFISILTIINVKSYNCYVICNFILFSLNADSINCTNLLQCLPFICCRLSFVVACWTEQYYLLPKARWPCEMRLWWFWRSLHPCHPYRGWTWWRCSTSFDKAQFRKSGIADCVNLMALGEARQGLEAAWWTWYSRIVRRHS